MRPWSGSCSRLKRMSFSLIAVYIRTGAFTSPNEMEPVQTARGVFAWGIGGKSLSEGAAGLKDTPPGRKPLPVRALFAGEQREDARVMDAPRTVKLEPQELDHAVLAVVEVEPQERPVPDGADQLGVGRALEERRQVAVALAELGRELRPAGLEVAGVQGSLEGARDALHLKLHGRRLHEAER